MTLQGLSNSYYLSNLYGNSSTSSAASGLSQLAVSSDDPTSSSTSSVSQKRPMRPPPPPDGADMEAAKQKLEEVDSDLAAKMEQFNKKMNELKDSGASQETIQATMKENMDSLSDTERSELQSVFGNPKTGGPGGTDGPSGPADMVSDLITQLKTTDSTLANKLQSFEDSIQELKDNGASNDEIQSAIASNIDSLSDSEKSTIEDAMRTLMAKRHAAQTDSASSTSSGIDLALLQYQVNSTYGLQANAAQDSSALALAA